MKKSKSNKAFIAKIATLNIIGSHAKPKVKTVSGIMVGLPGGVKQLCKMLEVHGPQARSPDEQSFSA